MASQPEYELGVNWFLRREENRRRSSEKPWDLNQQQTVCSPIHDKLHIKRSNIKLNRQHLYKYYTTLQFTNLEGVKRERSAKNVFHKGDSLYSQKPSLPLIKDQSLTGRQGNGVSVLLSLHILNGTDIISVVFEIASFVSL